jgi:hypothetical protein
MGGVICPHHSFAWFSLPLGTDPDRILLLKILLRTADFLGKKLLGALPTLLFLSAPEYYWERSHKFIIQLRKWFVNSFFP